MEIRLLNYFYTIAKVGSISQAAKELHITQPTLSRQLKDLEVELGTELFTREKNKLELTDAGRFLKSRAQEILTITKQTQEEFETRKSELFGGHLAIGCVEADNSDTLAMILEELLQDYPHVTFHIHSGTSVEIAEQLDKGLLDVAILLEPVDTEKYETITLPRAERWGLFTSKKSAVAMKEMIEPDDLKKIPLMFSSRKGVQDLILTWGDFTLEDLNVIGTYNLIPNIYNLVENNVGSMVTIEGVITSRKLENTVFIPLYPKVHTNCVFVWKKHRALSMVVKELIQRFKHAF